MRIKEAVMGSINWRANIEAAENASRVFLKQMPDIAAPNGFSANIKKAENT
ncbi:hypothetical protein [Mesorhizobium sp. M0159]|uniref:hypothetical protein n=1 Tax=Mesorhizobium sp. M0159 TaxID=2956900 RepID=UPI0033398518